MKTIIAPKAPYGNGNVRCHSIWTYNYRLFDDCYTFWLSFCVCCLSFYHYQQNTKFACTHLTRSCQFLILSPTKKDQEGWWFTLWCWNFQELSLYPSPKFWYLIVSTTFIVAMATANHTQVWTTFNFSDIIDLMHDDVARPEGGMGVAVTLKSKMAASSASSGGNNEMVVYLTYLKAKTIRPIRYSTTQPHQNTCQ